MIYITRDSSGQIANITFSAEEGGEEIGLFEPELKIFLASSDNEALVKDILEELDLGMVRVIEDMIDVLIHKELILFTDLPEPVQNKLLFKRSVRQSISSDSSLISEEEMIHF